MGAVAVCAVARDVILPLRQLVLRPGKPPETARFPGDELPDTRHYAAFDGDAVVGCATFLASELDGERAWQLRGMATDPGWQGRGAGRALLDVAYAELAGTGVRAFWCNARTSAAGFYEKMGWRVISPEWVIEGIGPHVKMSWRA